MFMLRRGSLRSWPNRVGVFGCWRGDPRLKAVGLRNDGRDAAFTNNVNLGCGGCYQKIEGLGMTRRTRLWPCAQDVSYRGQCIGNELPGRDGHSAERINLCTN